VDTAAGRRQAGFPDRAIDTTDPQRALLQLRIIWAAMLAGQVAFLLIVLALVGRETAGASGFSAIGLFWIVVLALVVATPMSYGLRNQMYKRHWEQHRIQPRGYLSGNVILFGVMEGVCLLGLVVTLLEGRLWPNLLPCVAAMAIAAFNFPSGTPMRAQTPNFARQAEP
jgi:hypothetical protein